MKALSVVLGMTLFSMTAMADQKATITCKGENVILMQSSPYLGENSKSTQSLIIIARNASDVSRDAAYFLDVDMEGDADLHQIYSVGKNQQGGKFLLKTGFWQDTGDGTVVSQQASGTLTYSHGPLQGQEVPVKCVKQ